MILMPLTFDITAGIGAGFVSWVLIKVVRGKVAEIHPLMWVVRSPSSSSSLQGLARAASSPSWGRSATTCGRRLRRRPLHSGPDRPSGTIPAMFERTELAEGPRVISAQLPAPGPCPSLPTCLAGSRLEAPGQAGVAHFLEHLTFKGTAAYPVDAGPREAIEGVGGSFNAATDRESTVYWARVPRREATAASTSSASSSAGRRSTARRSTASGA